MSKKKFLNYLYFAIIVVVCVVVDLLLKYLTDGQNFPLIQNFISIMSTHNTGGAWSIFSDKTLALTIFSIIFLAMIVVLFVLYKNKNFFFNLSCALIIAGAVGNLVDRIFLRYVRDFIRLDFMNFPIFNFADMCICVGAVLICVYFIFFEKKFKGKQND